MHKVGCVAVSAADLHAYLRRLGWAARPAPTKDTLIELHRAHAERIPYETVWIALGDKRSVDPGESVRHLLAGRGGYCYHLNGAFGALLAWLGYEVHRHRAGVQGGPGDPREISGNHLGISVTLPDEGTWMVDLGLGDGLHEPVPLRTGRYPQGPMTFGIRPSTIAPGGWRFDHDPFGSFEGADFAPEGTVLADFAENHRWQSTSPESGHVRVVLAARRDEKSVSELRGRVLTVIDTSGRGDTELEGSSDYFAVLAEVFGLPLSDVDARRKAGLWARVCTDHEAYLATKR